MGFKDLFSRKQDSNCCGVQIVPDDDNDQDNTTESQCCEADKDGKQQG